MSKTASSCTPAFEASTEVLIASVLTFGQQHLNLRREDILALLEMVDHATSQGKLSDIDYIVNVYGEYCTDDLLVCVFLAVLALRLVRAHCAGYQTCETAYALRARAEQGVRNKLPGYWMEILLAEEYLVTLRARSSCTITFVDNR